MRIFSGAMAVVLLGASAPSFAQDYSRTDPVDGPIEINYGPWDFGLDVGMIVPAKKGNFSHDISNGRAYDLIYSEGVGDEIGEGWVPPLLTGYSHVAGTIKPMGELGGHILYQFKPWLASGLEGGWGMSRQAHIDDHGIYVPSNFMDVHYSANISHFSIPFKFSTISGDFRPHVSIGPGGYFVIERADVAFTDPDDPLVKPTSLAHHNYIFFGVHAGAGFDWHVTEKGVLSLDVQYHKIAPPGSAFDFVMPKLRLSVLF